MTLTKAVLAAALGLAILCGSPAHASNDTAWSELFQAATTACQKASGLANAKAVGQPTDFSDRVLVIVKGRWPQPHMKNAKATFACLYGKTDSRAEAMELMTQ